MAAVNNFILIVVAFLCLNTNQVLTEKSCKEFVKEATEKTMQSFFQCKKDMTFKSEEEKIARLTCVLVCAMKKQNFLTPDGYVDESSLLTYVEREIPASIQSRVMELMLQCQSHATNLDPAEEKCLSYSGLLKCALSVIFKVCHT